MSKKAIINKDQYIKLWNENKTHFEISQVFGIGERTSQAYAQKLKAEGCIDERLVDIRTSKDQQKERDLKRIERKDLREMARIENAVVELQNELLKLIETKVIPKKVFAGKKIRTNKKAGAIVHLSDLHFNELINLMFNRYDFTIASKRLRKFVKSIKLYLQAHGVKDICVAMTGDLLNSDRRLDEILSQATNRAKAVMLSVTLLEQVLLDLSKDFNVSVASVIGNESRITEDVGWVEDVASDNYDFIIHQFLKKLFVNSKIKFFSGRSTEQVVELAGQHILLVHGNQVKKSKMEQSIQSIIGKWSANGEKIDFVISGHLHSCRIGDYFARSSSLAGGNAYSNDALQLYSRASQNLHIFFENGNRDSIKIDLQNVEDIIPYPIVKELEAYNAKSVDKSKKKTTVHKIVI
jgi:predicted MPP superfamily phosphohydrolase